MISSVEQVADIIGVGVVLAFGFYAVKILASFRAGMLEKGWKQVAYGGIALIVAQLFLISGDVFSGGMNVLLSVAGTLTRFLGMILIILGMRTHYQVWRLDNKSLAPAAETRPPLEH